MFVNTKTACKQLGVHPNTLRNWDKQGKIKTKRTPGNVRLYDLNSLNIVEKKKVVYARVSSKGQSDDLESQIKYLRSRCPEHELVQDISSGLNFKRKGFNSLLEQIMSGTIQEVVVTHRDRLVRFGFELIEKIAQQYGCKIVVLNEITLSPQEELVRDLLSIVHSFSCRLYGLRKYSRKIKEDKDLSKVKVDK